jgi:hypothetical protein
MNKNIGPHEKTETKLVCDGCRFYLQWFEGGPKFSCRHPIVGEQQIDRNNLQTFCPIINPRPTRFAREILLTVQRDIKEMKCLITSIKNDIIEYDSVPVSSARPEEIEGRHNALVWRQEDLERLLYSEKFLMDVLNISCQTVSV